MNRHKGAIRADPANGCRRIVRNDRSSGKVQCQRLDDAARLVATGFSADCGAGDADVAGAIAGFGALKRRKRSLAPYLLSAQSPSGAAGEIPLTRAKQNSAALHAWLRLDLSAAGSCSRIKRPSCGELAKFLSALIAT